MEQDEEKNETVFYVNFQGKNPNEETVEINVRENCFYPSKEGIGYIMLSGFVVKQAATQWAPPDGISGRNGRPALVKGMDHRGL